MTFDARDTAGTAVDYLAATAITVAIIRNAATESITAAATIPTTTATIADTPLQLLLFCCCSCYCYYFY